MTVTVSGLLIAAAIIVAAGTCGLWVLMAFASGMSDSPSASEEAMRDAKAVFICGIGIAGALGFAAWLLK